MNILVVAAAGFAALAGSLEAAELRQAIDRHIEAAWQRESIAPAPPATDGEFLRRVYLDLAGTIPTYAEAKAFLEDTDPEKRSKVIDRLLDDPRYAQHQADQWDLVFFGRNPQNYDARRREGFQRWLKEVFEKNVPYDEWTGAILKADGNTWDDGAPMFLVQYARSPEDAADATTRIFLGVQLQCARCHDHPFEDLSQVDFYGMAAFFARLETVKLDKKEDHDRIVLGEKNQGEVLFTGPASEQEPGQKGEPIPAKFLKGEAVEEPELPEDFEEPRNFPSGKAPPEPKFSRKDALADWIARPENPYFARAAANRVWAQFLGRGIVQPVDHFSEINPPSHPELLDELTRAFVEHDFDLKWYIRELCNSRTYQLSSLGDVEEAKPQWFQRAPARPLSAEELISSWRTAVSYYEALEANGQKPRDDRYEPLGSGYLLRFFGKPNNGTGDFQGGLHEHLYMNNGGIGKLMTTQKGSLHHTLATSEAAWPERVERLFLSVLSRPPSPEEEKVFVEYLSAEDDPGGRLQEALWTLLTCSEFRFNH